MKYAQVVLLMLACSAAYGKIWIVDSNTGSTAKDFTTLNAAYTGAAAGDTLYLVGSPNNYLAGKVTLSKRLIIIGPGYFLNENPDTQTNTLSSYLFNAGTCGETLEFAVGSEGSVMMGVTIAGKILITTNNILIKRNFFTDGQPGCPEERVMVHGSNCIITQNFIAGTGQGKGILIGSGYSNIKISNNYILNYCSGCGGGELAINGIGSSLEISNNLFTGGISVSNSIVENNIFRSNNSFNVSSSIVRNNIHVFNPLPGGNGNINNVPEAILFVGPGSTDGRWQLLPGSPASGAGFGGVDCGIYGGIEPYVLSGIPPIPNIYLLTAPAIGEKNTGLPITIKIKSNN